MAQTKHMIHSLGKSVSFGMLSWQAKILWPMLCSDCDDQGRFDARARAVKWQICPNVEEIGVDDIPSLLQEMANEGMIQLYGDGDRYAQMINWWPYQPMSYARPSKYPAPDGWIDRIRVRKGEDWITKNWDSPGGFEGQAKDAESVDLPLGRDSEGLAKGSPRDSDKATYNNNKVKQHKVKEGNTNNNKPPVAVDAVLQQIKNHKQGLLKQIGVKGKMLRKLVADDRISPEEIMSCYEDACKSPSVRDPVAVTISNLKELSNE